MRLPRDLDRRLRLQRFCADRIRCLLRRGQEGIDILAMEFLGLILLWGSTLARGKTEIHVFNQTVDIRRSP